MENRIFLWSRGIHKLLITKKRKYSYKEQSGIYYSNEVISFSISSNETDIIWVLTDMMLMVNTQHHFTSLFTLNIPMKRQSDKSR